MLDSEDLLGLEVKSDPPHYDFPVESSTVVTSPSYFL